MTTRDNRPSELDNNPRQIYSVQFLKNRKATMKVHLFKSEMNT